MDAVKTFLNKHDKEATTEVISEMGQAVTQETVIEHVHNEEAVAIDRERHIHHHQHRVQPIADTVHQNEVHETVIAPEVTKEVKAEMPAAQAKLLDGLKSAHKDTRTMGETIKTASTLGATVQEHVVHHVHEHVTPVIQRETHTHKTVHVVVPVHEVIHSEPIIHESTVLPTLSLADFQKKLSLSGDAKHDGVHSADHHTHKVFGGEPKAPGQVKTGGLVHENGIAVLHGKDAEPSAKESATGAAAPRSSASQAI